MEYGIWKTQHTVNKTQYDRKAGKVNSIIKYKKYSVIYIYQELKLSYLKCC